MDKIFITKKFHREQLTQLERIYKNKINLLNDELREEKGKLNLIKGRIEGTFENMKEEIIILRRIAAEYNHPHECGWCGKPVHKQGEMHGKCLDAKTDAMMQIYE